MHRKGKPSQPDRLGMKKPTLLRRPVSACPGPSLAAHVARHEGVRLREEVGAVQSGVGQVGGPSLPLQRTAGIDIGNRGRIALLSQSFSGPTGTASPGSYRFGDLGPFRWSEWSSAPLRPPLFKLQEPDLLRRPRGLPHSLQPQPSRLWLQTIPEQDPFGGGEAMGERLRGRVRPAAHSQRFPRCTAHQTHDECRGQPDCRNMPRLSSKNTLTPPEIGNH